MEFKEMESPTHELVSIAYDEDYQSVIAVHSTKLGPALGGIRLKYYPNIAEQVTDALRLSEGMSYKNAVAGLNHGGGKSTICAAEWSEEIARKYAAHICYVNDELGVHYIGAPDMNTNNNCMEEIIAHSAGCEHVFYDPEENDCSISTANGVYESLLAVQMFTGKRHEEFIVNIEGLGKVGERLLALCALNKWTIRVADLDSSKAIALAGYYDVEAVDLNTIKLLDGVYCPCAIGATVDQQFLNNTQAAAVCGAANNQLQTEEMGQELIRKGILYIPDFIANAGGVIDVSHRLAGTKDKIEEHVKHIRKQASALLMAQASSNTDANSIAVTTALARIGE